MLINLSEKGEKPMSLILKGIDLPTKKQKTLIVEIAWDGDVWVDNHDRYELKYNSAKQIPKDDEEAIDILMKVRQGIREGEDHEPNIKRG